jgi:hypothetical protein
VFHPAGPGQDLRVFQLVPGHFGAGMIENHEPGARGALIDSPDEIGHSISLWWRFTGMSRQAGNVDDVHTLELRPKRKLGDG